MDVSVIEIIDILQNWIDLQPRLIMLINQINCGVKY